MAQAALQAGVEMVFVGIGFETKDNLNHPELKSFKQFKEKYSGQRGIQILGYVPDEDLVGIVNLSLASMLVSFYEGFGLPVLEAQACGIPVITSDVSSLPEIVLDSAIKVDPGSVNDITQAIKKVSTDENYRKELVKKGSVNVERFNWKKVAEETLKVYEKVVNG